MAETVQVLPDESRDRGITDDRCFAIGRGAARRLFVSYAEELGIDLGFQGFTAELADLPGAYGPPWGVLFLLWEGSEPVACGALRPLPQEYGEENTAEIKRLYVIPTHRGLGLSRKLLLLLIDSARTMGYRRVVLDTLDRLTAANALYRSAGFIEISSYNGNPLSGVRFFAIDL